jgi:DNA polymerase-4
MRSILHVDMDAFYASIEERENPSLRGLPIVVGGAPGGRGVVSTCSYAARRFGVHSAMPIARAVRLLPHGVFLPVRMQLYAAVSREVMTILHRYTPQIEPLSLDEAFLDVGPSERLFGDKVAIAERIRADIRAELALPASVGVAPNKFVAKIASDMAKPDGLLAVDAQNVREFLAPLPVRRIFGIGPEMEIVLKREGIASIGDLQMRSADDLERRFGPLGATLHALANGDDERPVVADHEAKSHGRETTFEKDVTDRRVLATSLLRFAADVAFELRRRRIVAKTVQLKLRYPDFTTLTREKSAERPLQTARRLYEMASELLEKLDPKRPVRLIGLSASGLRHEEAAAQRFLFANPDERLLRVERAMDSIRARYGKDGVRPASLLDQEGDRKAP